MFHYHIHVGIGLSELITLISIGDVPTLYLNKCSLNYLPTQFRYRYYRDVYRYRHVYRYRDVYRHESNVNIFLITKIAFDL